MRPYIVHVALFDSVVDDTRNDKRYGQFKTRFKELKHRAQDRSGFIFSYVIKNEFHALLKQDPS